MAVMTRAQLSSTVLPATALTAAQIAEGMQPGSNQQLAVYSILSCYQTVSDEKVKFEFDGGLIQPYSQDTYQYLTNSFGEWFYGSVCVLLDPGRVTGGGSDWRYARSPATDSMLPPGFTV
jgi:hypothetical protein